MRSTPNPPDDAQIVDSSGVPRWVLLLFVIAFALLGYALFAGYSDRQALRKGFQDANMKSNAIAASLDKANARIADLKGELDVTAQKLGLTQDELARARSLAQTVRKRQQESDSALRAQIGQVQQDTSTKFGEVATELTGTKNDVEATKKDLEATKGKLQTAIGDLGVQSGLIARNHEEVQELKRHSDRDIFEFQLKKSGSSQPVGPIRIQIRKADPKRFRYTMSVIADDRTIEKKDKTAGEPVQFYVRGARVPYEIIVFDISKNKVSGYLSAPKGSASAAAASSPTSNN